MIVFGGNSNRILVEKICKHLGIPVGKADVDKFSDGEINVKIKENIRGKDVFIVQSTNTPHSNLMELLIMIDACKRASASRITAVIPYYGYARQDRKDKPRVPITAKLVADLISRAGASRLLCSDLHADQIQGFFDIPVDHLYGSIMLTEYFQRKELKNVVVVAPDPGSIKMVRGFAKRMKANLAIIDKRRPKPNISEALHIIGEVEGKDIIIIDDMVDTAGTMCNGAKALREAGAKRISAGATHAVLSGNAKKTIESSIVEELVVTDSIMRTRDELPENTIVLSVAPLFAEAIKRIHNNESVSSLFEF
jgi:ribose-phosphate pyrophosphokinase